jgi:hypothetical protein
MEQIRRTLVSQHGAWIVDALVFCADYKNDGLKTKMNEPFNQRKKVQNVLWTF